MEENSGRSLLSSESFTSDFYGAFVVGRSTEHLWERRVFKEQRNGNKDQYGSSLEWSPEEFSGKIYLPKI